MDGLRTHSLSGSWVTSISLTKPLHQDFGGSPYLGNEPGFRINLVPGTQPKVPIVFREGAIESDPGPYPIPATPFIENGSDAHMLLLDTDNCILYETFDTYKDANGRWSASSGAIFDLRKNLLRPRDWTSADAAGLPILPGLVRYEEILEGEIRHALRFTAPSTRREYLWPARHYASTNTSLALPPMGARFRLKANFDITRFSPTMRIILTALKRYGMMLSDNGSSWFVQGTFDPRWPDLVSEFRQVPGSAFEAVDVSELMEDFDSAAARAPVTAPALDSVSLASSSLTGGLTTTLRISLSGPAPAGGTSVALSSNSAAAQIGAAAVVAAGSSFVDAPVNTSGVTSTTAVVFTATLTGVSRTATLSVIPPSVSTLVLNPSTVASGGSSAGTVTLSGVAPAGGLTVSLSAGSASAQVPAAVLVPANQRTANFAVTAGTVASDTVVQVMAAALSSSAAATLRITAPAPPPPPPAPAITSVSIAGAPLTAGQAPAAGAVALNAAVTTATTITVVSSNPSVAALAGGASISVAAGASGAGFTITPLAAGTTVVTASLGTSSVSFNLTVNAPATSGSGTEYFSNFPMAQYSTRTDFTGWAGMGFVANSKFKLTRLGRLRTGGQTGLRTVAIFTSWTAATPAVSVQVDLGSVPDGQFAYADIPGGYQMNADYYFYVVTQETSGRPLLWAAASGTRATTASVATVDRAAFRYASSEGFIPESGTKIPHGPVNFQFSTDGATPPPPPPTSPTLSAVSVSQPSVTGGAAVTGTVTLSAPATADTTVTLGATGPASVPASVTIRSGQLTGTFPVSTTSVTAVSTAVVQAALNAVNRSVNLTVNPAPVTPPAGTAFFNGLPLSQYTTRTDFTGWAGIGVATRQRFKVTRLGRMRTGGQTGLRTVAIFTSWAAATPAASVQVDLGSVPDGQFAYAEIPGGLQFEADRYLYVVSQEVAGQPVLWTTSTATTGVPGIAVVDRAAWKTANFDGFAVDYGIKIPYGAVNFQYTQ